MQHRKHKYLIINTDASFCPHTKVGGYAYWIKTDNLLIKGSGFFKSKVQSPFDAELKCIINALTIVSKQKDVKVDKVIVNTDALHVIRAYRTGKSKLIKLLRSITFNLKKSIGTNHVIFKHVKAHNGTDTPRKWVNDWCDSNAKSQMRKARELHKTSRRSRKS